MIKRICAIGIIGLAIALGGCAKQMEELKSAWGAVTGEVVTPQQVALSINAFDVAKASGTNYIRLPRCPTNAPVCRNPIIAKQVVSWLNAGTADRDTLMAQLRANPGQNLSVLGVYQDLKNTTSKIVSAIPKN